MLITNNLSVSGSLSLSSVSSTTTSLSALVLESGLVKSRNLGSMSLKGDNEYLPEISLSFPNIFNLNTSTLNFANQSLTVSLTNQPAKTFLAAPNNLAGTPSFRAILASDIPTLNQSTTGNAATATTLQTPRTLTIGNTGKSFDGSGNVSWSLAEIGAQPILTNPVTGTGTTNYHTKFTSSGIIGNSLIYDNGTNVGIGTTSLSEKLEVNGNVKASGFKTPTGTATQALTANGDTFDLTAKADLVGGKILASQLPAYVDDVLEFANLASFPATGESGKIYIAIDTNLTYRWGGSSYVVMSSSLALGETSSTAYRGDRGKIAYDHSQTTGNPHGTTKSDIGLGNVDNTSDLDKPISTATQSALNAKVDLAVFNNLQIGGRNLILNSDSNDTILLYGVTATYENIVDNQLPSKQYFKFTNVVRTIGNYVFYIPTATVGKFSQSLIGKKIQISFYIRSNNSQKLVFDRDSSQNFMIDSTWKKVRFNTVFNDGNLHFLFEGSGLTSFDISSVKIEFGDKATDWTPAPEDKQDRLQDITGNIGVGKTDDSATEKLDVNGNVKATSFIKSGGTSSQFLKADGSIDSNTYATQSWVTSNFANQTLSLGTETEGGQSISLSNGGSGTITNYFITSRDGSRNVNDTSIYPNANPRRVRFDFISAGSIGSSGNYAGVMTYSPYDGTTASTGDSSYQLAFINETGINGSGLPGLALRKGIDDTWGNFVNLLHTGNTTISYSGNTLQLLRNGNVISSTTINAGNTYTNGSNITISSNQISVVASPTFSGNVTASAFYESSLRELKENIQHFEKSGLELVNSLEIVTFDKKDGSAKDKIGIIADDSPEEFLSEDKDAVDLYKTVFIQAKAIQELTAKNLELEERLIKLEKLLSNG